MNNRIKELYYSNGLIKHLSAQPIISDTLITTTLGIVGRSAGLVVPFFVSAWFGITENTDAFFFMLGILVFFSGVFVWAIESVIVAFIVKLKNDEPGEVTKFVGSLLLTCSLFLIVTLFFSLLAVKPLLLLLTNFSDYSINLVWMLLLQISPVFLLVMVSGILSGTLNAYKLFWITALSTSLSLVLIIGTAFLLKGKFGIHAIVLGYILGEVCRFIFLLWAFRQNSIGAIHFSLQQRKTVREFLNTSVYMIIGMSIAGLSPIINRTIASHFDPGSISVLEYAEKMFYIPAGILGSGFLTVILSHWASRFTEEGAEKFWKSVLSTTKRMLVLALIGTIILFIFRFQLTSIAIDWGKIPEQKIAEVSQLFGIYLLGLIPNILNLVLGRAHLVLKNTVVLMQAAFIGVAVLLLFNAMFTPNLGLLGIALALTGSQFVVSLFLFLTLMKSLKAQYEQF